MAKAVHTLVPHSPFLIPRSPFLVPRSSFPVPRSPFLVPRSSFLIPRSSFPVPRSSFLVPHRSLLKRRLMTVSIRLVSSIRPYAGCSEVSSIHPSRSHSSNWVCNSEREPCAMARNWDFSRRDSRDQPSAMLLGMDMAARVICRRTPKRSSAGRRLEHRQAVSASVMVFCQITALR